MVATDGNGGSEEILKAPALAAGRRVLAALNTRANLARQCRFWKEQGSNKDDGRRCGGLEFGSTQPSPSFCCVGGIA